MKRNQLHCFFTGEYPLISEFGEHCHSVGARTDICLNRNEKAKALPRYFRKVRQASAAHDAGFELTITDRVRKMQNLRMLDRTMKRSAPILTSSVSVTVTEQATWIRHPERLVGISAFPTLIGNTLLEVAPGARTDRSVIEQACRILEKLGKESTIIEDRVGLVLPRILCMLINEAFFAAMEQVADPPSIDLAMKLGTNYPLGPIEWSERIGLRSVVTVLQALHDEYGEDRYRIAPLLRECTRSGLILNT